MGLTHSAVVVVPDDPTFPVGSDEWNDDHVVTGAATGALLYADASDVVQPATGLTWDEALKALTVTGSANALTIAGSAAGSPVSLTASGSDTAIPIWLKFKGARGVDIGEQARNTWAAAWQSFATGVHLTMLSDTTDASNADVVLGYAGATPIVYGLKSEGTLATPTDVVTATGIYGLSLWGYKTGAFRGAGGYNFTINGTPTTNGIPTDFLLFLSDGATSTYRLSLYAAGGMAVPEIAAPALSAAAEAKWYADSTAHTLKLSVNGGAYSDILTAAAGVSSITGTANQVIASAAVGAVTLSLPQSIATTSTPQFAGLGLGAASGAAGLTFANATLLVDTAANVLEQYSGTTAGQWNLYNTRTSSTNYERLDVKWASNVLTIQAAKGSGGGSNRLVALGTATQTRMVALNTSDVLGLGHNAGATFAQTWIQSGASQSPTSGTDIQYNFIPTYNPGSTSTLIGKIIRIAPTINFTAGTPGAGQVIGIEQAWTETAMPTGQSYFALWKGGSAATTEIFSVTNLGLVNIGGSTGYVQMTEITAPAAGAANTCRLFVQDNGAGKTQLMAIFNTGAAQQVAIQP